MMFYVHLDFATEKRLKKIAQEKNRDVYELAETAIAEEALRYFKNRKDDPA